MVRALAERRIAVIQDDKEKSLQRVRNGIIRAQSNFFRFARYNLTLTEQKMIYFAIMTGEQTKKPFSPVLMPVKEFVKLAGYDGGGRTYMRVREIANNLTKKNVEVAYRDAKGHVKYIAMPWLMSIQYSTGDGVVEIVPNPKLREHFTPGKQFTVEEYYYLFKFKSQYSARLYELLKSHAYKEKPLVDFEVGDLRARLGVEPGKYAQYAGFRSRVILPAIEDINGYTDLVVEIREKTSGRKITRVYFAVEVKDIKPLAQREDEGLLPAKAKRKPAKPDEEAVVQVEMSILPYPGDALKDSGGEELSEDLPGKNYISLDELMEGEA